MTARVYVNLPEGRRRRSPTNRPAAPLEMPWIQRPSRRMSWMLGQRDAVWNMEKPPWGMVYYGLTMKNDGLTMKNDGLFNHEK